MSRRKLWIFRLCLPLPALALVLVFELLLRAGFRETPAYQRRQEFRTAYAAAQHSRAVMVWLGDSFAEGEYGKKMEALASSRGVGFVNLASSGKGVPYYWETALRHLSRERVETIVLNYYVGNDLSDTLYAQRGLPFELRHWLLSSHLVSHIYHKFVALDFARRSSRIAKFVERNPQVASGVRNPWLVELGFTHPDYLMDNLLVERQAAQRAWSQNEAFLTDIQGVARQLGARLVVTALPATLQVNRAHREFYRKLGFILDDRIIGSSRPQELLAQFCQERKIPFLDPLPKFREQASRALYLDDDDHWSPEGNALSFEVVRQWLEAQHVL